MAKSKNSQGKSSKSSGGSSPMPSFERLKVIEPLTDNQKKAFNAYLKKNNSNLVLSGSAGTGKTFLAMYLALQEILSGESKIEKLVIVRSIVPTRDIGFLPGDRAEKESTYLYPYIAICAELFGDSQAWAKLIALRKIEFMTTSFVRGITLRNSVVMIDEMQNLTFHELDSIITRLGDNCRFVVCGDYYQSDLQKNSEKSGIKAFLEIIEQMKHFHIIEFGWQDIVRSGLVRDYIMTKEMAQRKNDKA
jgi:phosphate starvation-inducible PhoH-like protein